MQVKMAEIDNDEYTLHYIKYSLTQYTRFFDICILVKWQIRLLMDVKKRISVILCPFIKMYM